MTQQRLGLFGGTFNPPHLAHFDLARLFIQYCAVDYLFILPTGHSYHKKADIASRQTRYDMCLIAFSSLVNTIVERSDIDRQGPTYTVDTLRRYHAQYRNAAFYWLLGGDAFLQLEHWHDYAQLVTFATFAIAPRDEIDRSVILKHAHQFHPSPRIRILPVPPIPYSSSPIRTALNRGEKNILGLDPKVENYIREHHLYHT